MRIRLGVLCGVLTVLGVRAQSPEEVLKKLKASAPPANTGQKTAPASVNAGQGHYYRLKLVKITDTGFGEQQEVVRFLIPADWRIEGGIRWTNEIRCPINIIQFQFRATSPDGASGMEYLPGYTWVSSNDQQTAQIQQRSAASQQGCDAGPVVGVLDYLGQRIAAKTRQGARIIASEPLAALTQAKQASLMQAYGPLIQQGVMRAVKAESGALRLTYTQSGQPVEEWMMTTLNMTVSPTPDSAALYQGQLNYTKSSFVLSSEATFAAHFPAGKIDPKLIATILASVRPNPVYQTAVSNFLANMNAIALKGVMDRAKIWREAQQQISATISQSYQQNQAIQDRAAERFSQTIRGVETYVQPDGSRVELTGGYDNAWINNRGEYLLSDQAGFNPAVQFQEDWKPLRKTR